MCLQCACGHWPQYHNMCQITCPYHVQVTCLAHHASRKTRTHRQTHTQNTSMQRWIRIIPNSSAHFFTSKMFDLQLSLRASRGAARVVQQCRAIVQRQPTYSLPYMQMNYTMSYRTRILGGVELCRFCGAGLALSFVNTATKLSHCCWSTRCSRPWARAWTGRH